MHIVWNSKVVFAVVLEAEVLSMNETLKKDKLTGKNRISETVLLDCFLIVTLAILSYYLDPVIHRHIIRLLYFCLILLTIINVARVSCDIDEIPKTML